MTQEEIEDLVLKLNEIGVRGAGLLAGCWL
jgi:hypothetical protein